MKEAATTKAFVKMMAAFVTMVGKHPMIVPVRFQFNGWYKNHNLLNSDEYNYLFSTDFYCTEDYDCNNKGLCTNGTCLCQSGWKSDLDCSGNLIRKGTTTLHFQIRVPKEL